MSYSILSHEVKQQLEQERSRLRSDREAIIQSAVQQATVAIDRTLQQLDSLLGEPENNGSSNHLLDSEPQSDSPKAPSKQTSTPKDQSSTKSNGKGRQATVNRFNGKVLKPEFAHLSPIEAMVQVINQSPEQTFGAEEIIRAVYDEFDPADLPSAKRSVKITLVGGAKKGLLERVQENPPLFKALMSQKPLVDASRIDPLNEPTEVTSREADGEEPADSAKTSPKKASRAKAQPRARAKEKGKQPKSQSFNPKEPKRSFRGMEPLQAMVDVTATHPEQSFSTADIIREVYGEFEEAEMPRALKSVAGTLARGVQRGFLEKTQSNPALFKFKASGEESRLA
jgi:hypothetical protein